MSKEGTLWELPGGHRAIQVSGSTRDVLRVSIIKPNWPFPQAPTEVARCLCKALPMRYLKGQVPDVGEAMV